MTLRSSLRPLFLGSLVAVSALACGAADNAGNAQSANAALTSEPGSGGRRFDPARMVARFDANHDGRTTLDELPPRMRERVQAADADHDGAITAEELQAHMQTRRAERFRRHDTNGDGAITADEAGERWERIRRADANSDGRVTAEELQGAFAQMRAHPMGRRHGEGRGPGEGREAGEGRGHRGWGRGHGPGAHGEGFDPARRLARFDANGDGRVEVSELPERMQQRIAGADANRDGVIAPEEMRSFFEARRAERLRMDPAAAQPPAAQPAAPAEVPSNE
ncbi:MAG: hypothetical protein R3A48_27330 [Polyangiales bacterium]